MADDTNDRNPQDPKDPKSSKDPQDPKDPNAPKNPNDAGLPDDGGFHFDDAELDAAMSDFEKEFDDTESDTESDTPSDDSANLPDFDDQDLIADFDDLDKAKVAILITRIASAKLLAAFCQLSDISATCIGDEQGAVAILHNLDGNSPENAAESITSTIAGMPVVLAVNRMDNVVATIYVHGKAGETLPPPLLFASSAPFVEDLMLGINTLDDLLLGQPKTSYYDSADFDRQQAIEVLAEFSSRGRRRGFRHGNDDAGDGSDE